MKKFLPAIVLCLLTASFTYAQKPKKSKVTYNKANKEKDVFLKKQWWIGLRGGRKFFQSSYRQAILYSYTSQLCIVRHQQEI